MSIIARATPTTTSRTPDSGMVRVAAEGRASRAVAQALGVLVERLMSLGPARAQPMESAGTTGASAASPEPSDTEFSPAREALRHLVARSREGVMLCRVVNGTLILEGVPVDRGPNADAVLAMLLRRLIELDIGSLTIREGAAPGELLTLAGLLAQPAGHTHAPTVADESRAIGGQTPASAQAAELTSVPVADGPAELLRTWSVLVTANARERPKESPPAPPGSAFARFSAARSDDAIVAAVEALAEVLDDAQRRGDASAIESIARACMTRLQTTGESSGRLALESLLRRLHRAPVLDLLALQLPHSADRASLLQLFARAGDAGVDVLVHHLMTTDDSRGRRAYFDGIIAMDAGSRALFDALRDGRWFVVRNAAALLGEMGAEHADEELIALLRHDDARLRVAAARALMRLRTVKSLHALHATIDDANPELRRLSAAAFGLAGAMVGGGVRSPAARLAAALEVESDHDVALEMLAALGRLGTADAVQRLIRIAMPATTDTNGAPIGETRPAWIRIASLEALVKARGSQMHALTEELARDADPEVAAAAAAIGME